MMTRDELAAYFRGLRAANIGRYRVAKLWVQRKDARSWVLHYGRLIRKLEGRV